MIDPAPSVGSREAGWQSLRLRLPLAMSALIALVLAGFLWVAFRQVESALLEAGGARAQGAADQLANLLALQARQRLGDIERAARSAAVRTYLQHPDESTAAVARQRLAPTVAGQPSVEIWNDHGQRLLTVTGPSAGGSLAAERVPVTGPPAGPGVSAFRVSNDVVFWDTVGDVREEPLAGAPGSPNAAPLGYVVSRRLLSSASASDVIGRLVGRGAVIKIGNQSGGVWTDLSKVVPPPPVDASRIGVSQVREEDGQRHIGASTPIPGTPWAAWVEFPRDVIVAPARTFLTRMIVFGFCFVVAAAVLARALSARITTPLRTLTAAAERIAAGQSVERVVIARHDEVGRLGAAFNTMATQVHDVQRELEEQVDRRTARLAETSALLEQRVTELDATRQELDRFFELSLDMLCIAGTDGYFKRLNPAWTRTLGWTDDELRSKPYVNFVHPDDREDTIARAGRLADGSTVVSFENRYLCRDGSYRWLEWKAIPAGDGAAIYTSTRDVTDQKARESHIQTLNEQLALRVSELDALTGELEAFSYSVSHDLRAPLRHVTGFASLLQQSAGGRLAETDTRYLRTIVDAAARMGRLIDDLLAFSRMGRAPLARQRVSLDALVQEARTELQGIASDRAAIAWTIHPLPNVEGDPAMLRLVLVNLLSNAIKYTAVRDRPAVEVGEDGSTPRETVFYVRDNGVGFDMQYAHKLFGVFQRLHSSDEFEGTGIGLANVRRIVQRHGGRVWAEGAVDAGATFFIALPKGGEERP